MPTRYCLRSRLSWRRCLPLQAALLSLLLPLVARRACAPRACVLAGRDEDRVIDVVQHAVARDAAAT